MSENRKKSGRVRFPSPSVRARIATELGLIWPLENWLVIPRENRADNVTGEVPQLKAKLGDPDKTNAQLAKEFSEELGGPVTNRQVSKWRNRRIEKPVAGTSMPKGQYRSNR